MATINDIKAYVRETPYNTNTNVLDSLLDSLEISSDEVIYEKSVSFLGIEPQQQESRDYYQIEDSSLNNLSITENTIVYINGDQAEMNLQSNYWSAIIENENDGIMLGSDSEHGIIGLYVPSGESIPDEYMNINIKIVNSTQQEEGSGIIVATIVNQNVSTKTISYTCDYTYEQLSTLIQSKEVYFKGDKMENMESDRLYKGDFIIGSNNSFILIIIENNYEIIITDEGIEVNYRDDSTPMT